MARLLGRFCSRAGLKRCSSAVWLHGMPFDNRTKPSPASPLFPIAHLVHHPSPHPHIYLSTCYPSSFLLFLRLRHHTTLSPSRCATSDTVPALTHGCPPPLHPAAARDKSPSTNGPHHPRLNSPTDRRSLTQTPDYKRSAPDSQPDSNGDDNGLREQFSKRLLPGSSVEQLATAQCLSMGSTMQRSPRHTNRRSLSRADGTSRRLFFSLCTQTA